MRAPLKPGGAVRQFEAYAIPDKLRPELIAVAETTLGQILSPELRKAIVRRIETFVDQQRNFTRSQDEAEMRAQLGAVVADGEAFARAADAFAAAREELIRTADVFAASVAALGTDAEGRYLDRLPEDGDIAREMALRAVLKLPEPAQQIPLQTISGLAEPAREALERLPKPPLKADRGKPGQPVLAALVLEAKAIFELAGRKVTERDRGPFVEFVVAPAVAKVLPRDVRPCMPDKPGDTIKGILRCARLSIQRG